MQFLRSYWWLLALFIVMVVAAIIFIPGDFRKYDYPHAGNGFEWNAPDINRVPNTPAGDLIRYGNDIIANTAVYFGPKGKIAPISNGMNCQNCHLAAGTKPWGNNYSAVASTYPKFRARSGSIETIYKRINDCFERSLDGKSIDSNSHEMIAIAAYIKWLGANVPKNEKPYASGIIDLPFLNRAANPVKGKEIYAQNCQRCHAADGQGTWNADSTAYQYPPLWGNNSYNTGAGLFRVGRLAGYVKHNMPFDQDQKEDVRPLTDEESWDVAAYILSQPRPVKKFAQDWPDISAKPYDHPFGPYRDSFSESQHKYGPFEMIVAAKKRK